MKKPLDTPDQPHSFKIQDAQSMTNSTGQNNQVPIIIDKVTTQASSSPLTPLAFLLSPIVTGLWHFHSSILLQTTHWRAPRDRLHASDAPNDPQEVHLLHPALRPAMTGTTLDITGNLPSAN
jgi:hypothetical protein